MSRFSSSQSSASSRFTGSTNASGGSRFSSGGKPKQSQDQATSQLVRIAQDAGYGKQAEAVQNPPKKLSVLRRVAAGLGAFETGNAVFKAIEQKSVRAGLKQYATDVKQGITSAFSGKDIDQTGKKRYKDLLNKAAGGRNSLPDKVIQTGGGLFADIFLDPSTYVGGRAVRAVTGAAGKVTNKVVSSVKLASDAKDALGKTFVFGYKTSKGLPEKTLETVGQISKAKEGIVRSNIERLGTGTLSKSQQEELVSKLLTGKRAEFAGESAEEAIRAARSSDPVVQKTITSQIERSQQFAKNAGIDDPYTVYFPGIAKDKIRKLVENPSFLRVSQEGYKKEFKNLLKDDELIRNPAEAFARTEFAVAKDSIVRSQLSGMVKQFGKPLDAFKSADDALKAGFVEVKEKGQFGKVIGYLAKEDRQFIDQLISPEFTTIDRLAKATGFDAVTSLFKRSVTGLFAPFHVRNYVSGLIQNYEVLGPKALSPANLATGQRIAYKLARGDKFGDEVIKVGQKSYKLDKVMEPFAKRFETSSQYISDFAEATGGRLTPTRVSRANPLSENFLPFKYARAIGNFVETQQKATAYMTALREGRTVKQALDYATRAGFDYRALTPFESKVMRRIIPFYSFTRKNIELQLRTLGENPQRISNVIKLAENLSGNLSEEEKSQLPDYAKEQFAFKTGTTASGLPEIAVGFGTGIEQIAQLLGKNPVRRIAATINPIFKVPLERAFKRDFFRDRPLSEVVEASEYARSPQWVKDFLQATAIEKKSKDGKVRTVYNANPYRLQLLRSLPTTRGATYISAIYDVETPVAKVLNSVTGVKPRPIDLETVEYFRVRDNQRELEDLLIQAGVLKRFEKTYQPKSTK